MFSQEAFRLLREKWPDADMLAEELYAIFGSINLPLAHDGPITINMQPGQTGPALTIRTADAGQPAIQIQRASNPGSPINITEAGIDLGDAGLTRNPLAPFTINLGTTELGGNPTSQPFQAPGGGGGGAGGGAAGTVVSGSGKTYQVQLVTGQTVTATQLVLADGETIPPGTGVILAQVSGVFYMQAPVWS